MTIFGKLAYDAGVSVMTLLFVRFTIAALVLWAAFALRGGLPRAARGTIAAALALGAVAYATQAGLFFNALSRMDASLLALILYTYPALVTVGAIALGRESASRRRAAALLVSSGGLVLVLAGTATGGLDALGVAMGLGASVTYAGYILVSHAVTEQLPPLAFATLVTTGAATSFGVAGLATGTLDLGFHADGWLWLVLIALISTVLAIVLFFAGLQRVGPSSAAILSVFEPLSTVVFAYLAFGESLSALQMAGGALVVAAVIALQIRPPQPAPAQRSGDEHAGGALALLKP
jgi:drug/metabolite transporter (DMT)-like permease